MALDNEHVVITIPYLAGFELFKRGRAIMLRFVAVDTRDIEATTRQTRCKQPITHHHHIIRRREERRRAPQHTAETLAYTTKTVMKTTVTTWKHNQQHAGRERYRHQKYGKGQGSAYPVDRRPLSCRARRLRCGCDAMRGISQGGRRVCGPFRIVGRLRRFGSRDGSRRVLRSRPSRAAPAHGQQIHDMRELDVFTPRHRTPTSNTIAIAIVITTIDAPESIDRANIWAFVYESSQNKTQHLDMYVDEQERTSRRKYFSAN